MDINLYFEIVWIVNWNLGQIFAQHRILLDTAALLKTLQHVLSLELNDTSTSNLPFENYTDCLLSHGLCSKFCSSLSWLSMDFVQPTCHPSFNNYPQRSRRSSSKLLFTVHTVNSVTYGKHAFSFSAPILWNSLPDSVKNTTSLSSFKSSLKTFLFRKFCFWFILRVTVPSFHVT